MISIVITAWDEPNATKECIKRFLDQNLPEFEMFVVCPDDETKNVVLEYKKQYSQIHHVHQPRELGKNVMMNKVMKEAKGDILIFTDGDIFVSENSVSEILKKFEDSKIGCVTGRPVSSNPKDNMAGYWSHLLTDAGAHNIRKEREQKGEFLECTGYLFAIRNGVIKEMPLDVAEDSIIPSMFWEKDYKIGYADKALAYVQFPTNFKDWANQKTRCAKSHEKVGLHIPVKRMKSFKNELIKGPIWALSYPKSAKEFAWTLALFPARLYMWGKYFFETKIMDSHYGDKWKRVQSTRPMD